MTTPTWTAFAEPSQFFNEAFSNNPVAGAGDNDFDNWASQLNSYVLELQTPVPRISQMNESSGSTQSTSTTNPNSIWDDRSPMVGMSTNGRAALAAIMQEQKNPEEFNLFGTDQVAAAAPPEVTDQLLFQQLRGRAGTAAMIWGILKKDTAFRNAVSDLGRFHCIDGVSTAILSQPPSNPRQEGCICYTKFIEPERNPAELKALASG